VTKLPFAIKLNQPTSWDTDSTFSRSYCCMAWSAIGISITVSSVCPFLCDALHCGTGGRCSGLKVVRSCT